MDITTKQMIEVMQAFLEGQEIEYQEFNNKEPIWKKADTPVWDWFTKNYRIKPKTKPSINWDHINEKWKYLARDENGLTYIFTDEPVQTKSRGVGIWTVNQDLNPNTTYANICNIFASYSPGDCNWKESLIIRPGYEN